MNEHLADSILLGLIQGLTEFLPVSSSGHLVLAKSVLDIRDMPVLYDVFFHLATVLAVCTLYKNELAKIIGDFTRSVFHVLCHKDRGAGIGFTGNAKLAVYIIIGTIPAALIGSLYENAIKKLFAAPEYVALFLMVTGIMLISTVWSSKYERRITAGSAILIGCAQSVALIPGVSRSGSTIAAGLWLGIKPEEAVKFSFFLAIPVILGANILEFSAVSISAVKQEILYLLSGGITAYLSGLIAITILMKVIQRGRFFWFGIYCIVAGAFGYAVI